MIKSAFNHLNDQTSPYLLQHADNPVEWYPWCEEALDRARREDKPILLSIGYSACHWCHVMAHESFEDPDTAKVMNRLYVNIKVDREERPDIDKIYQLAHQLLTQRPGGWPLNMFLTPDEHIPFFGGTYFPPHSRYNMPPFRSILHQAADYYHQQKDAIKQHNASFFETMQSVAAPRSGADLDASVLEKAGLESLDSFDSIHGGFGQAPKFPHCSGLEFLLGRWLRGGKRDERLLHAVIFSLEKMAQGGIYDQIGGGFCRYSVDDRWNIPHFEKMLYDNGPLLSLYAEAWQITGNKLFRDTALGIADWVIGDMQSPEGGFYSSRDADSEGEEGKFYVWSPDQVRALLEPEEFAIVGHHYGLERPANFEGRWHFYIAEPLAGVAAKIGITETEAETLLESARGKLRVARGLRKAPGRDDKILTSWNALMIKGLAIAARIFERGDLIDSAYRAFDFVHEHLWLDGRLMATHKDGRSHLNAYLDDYAYLIDAAIELCQSQWRTSAIVWATQLADMLIEQFEDKSIGGFFFTSNDHERLIHRPKPMTDESIPSGNGVAARALGRLGHILGNTDYLDAANRVFQSGAASMSRFPTAHCALLIALEDYFQPPCTVVLRGESALEWQKVLTEDFRPDRIVLEIPPDLQNLPGILSERKAEDQTVAYACTAASCLPPCHSLESLRQSLDA
ncbi:MAG: thioredoxin domain-containing protein [Methylococcaceae bacterium]|nr:thioredoxin domain-containing protein [Methylococcaceae bacterium]